MITPTVGRIVWFYPEGISPADQPAAAIVVYVHHERLVNLAVFDHLGYLAGETSVTLLQDDDPPAPRCCMWMPYQKGQAAKYEELEAQKVKAQQDQEPQELQVPRGLGLGA